jgi:two-component system C4-dicarboxylate transport response regulator DctD
MKKRQKQEIILVDDDTDLLEEIAENLELANHAVTTFSDPTVALEHINQGHDGIIISDVRMPNLDGHALLDAVQKIDRDIPFVMITGHGQVTQATTAMKAGAYDFLEKPIDPDQLHAVVGRALEKRNLHLQNERFKSLLSTGDLEAKIIGTSKQAQQLRQQVSVLASLHVDLIIKGETGTGKDLVARCLHEHSPRKDGPFVAVNCGALPASLIDSAFFGHERGAFTGAEGSHKGYFEVADGGTLFLDELESMPIAFQALLLRVLETREVTRLGSSQVIKLDFRVVAAIKGELSELVDENRLRSDLMYRLNVAALDLPDLAERKQDIEMLFSRFAEVAAVTHDRPVPDLDEKTRRLIKLHNWPGNIRELKNAAERFVIGLPFDFIERPTGRDGSPEQGLDAALASFEKQRIQDALNQSDGVIGEAASLLCIPRKKLYLRMKKHGISKQFLSD